MKKLLKISTVIALFTLVLPACSGNDDFTEMIQTIDNQQINTENVTDDEEEVNRRD